MRCNNSIFFAQEYFVQGRGLQIPSSSYLIIFGLFLIVRFILIHRFLEQVLVADALMDGLLYKEGIYALFLSLASIDGVLLESNYTMLIAVLFETSRYCSLILLMHFRKYFLVDLLSNIIRQHTIYLLIKLDSISHWHLY